MVEPDPATCPLCGDERPNAKSVEQHISGSSDSVHKGEHGPDYRDEIEAGSGPGDDPGGDPGDDSGGDSGAVIVDAPGGGSDSPPSSGGVPSQDTATSQDGESDDGNGVMGVVVLVLAMLVLAALAPNNSQPPGHPLL